MPHGDRTGPAGLGPMAGRAAGYCSGSVSPGFASAQGFGAGRGCGGGRRMGGGWRRGKTPGTGRGPDGERGRHGRGMSEKLRNDPTPPPARDDRKEDEAHSTTPEPIQEWMIKMENETKVVARIDTDQCAGCEACVDVCPSGAIQVVDGVAQVNEDECTGCGECVTACPLDAIRLE